MTNQYAIVPGCEQPDPPGYTGILPLGLVAVCRRPSPIANRPCQGESKQASPSLLVTLYAAPTDLVAENQDTSSLLDPRLLVDTSRRGGISFGWWRAA